MEKLVTKFLYLRHYLYNMHFFKSVRQTFTRLLIRCNKLSILSAHTTDEPYATKKDIRTFNDQPLFETASKFNFTSMKPAGIVIILVTAYQLSIVAVVNRNLIVT